MRAKGIAPSARPGPGQAALVEVAELAKAFGATQALRDCSFRLRAGEVHALVGENGSGKSTLVKILSGVHAPDSGSVALGGDEVRLRSPRGALDQGIAAVFQEVLVAESRSVLDNVWLGADDTWRTKIPEADKRREATTALVDLLGEPLDLRTPVEDLSLADRQACSIVRAILRKPRILILDEATSALDVSTRNRLFSIIRRLSRDGVGVIVITHRMDEIEEISDRITVMRNGRTVGTFQRGGWTPRELVRLMTGSDALATAGRKEAASAATRRGAPVLRAKGLKLRPDGRAFDVEIRAGELVGVAGLEGHGQVAFLRALCGDNVLAGEVVRLKDDGDVTIRSPRQAARWGVAYVPADRRREGLFSWMTIRENFALPTLGEDARLNLISLRSSRRRFAAYIKRLGVVLRSQDDAITTLSGGNQQKVIIARWLAARPRVLLLNDPTRGIDVGAKNDLYQLLAELASEGLAVVMLSTEVDEHVELMDRVLVFREHELFREIARERLSRAALVAAFFGEAEEVGVGAGSDPYEQ
jgi:ABC-type sugar transport system ATPase subunit